MGIGVASVVELPGRPVLLLGGLVDAWAHWRNVREHAGAVAHTPVQRSVVQRAPLHVW